MRTARTVRPVLMSALYLIVLTAALYGTFCAWLVFYLMRGQW